MITAEQFLELADRLAQQYTLLQTLVASLSPVATNAQLLTGSVGANTGLTWTALTAGQPGNDISIAFINPGTINQPLSITVVGNAITVSLQTDAGPSIISTAAQIIAKVATVPAAAALVSVANTSTSTGAGVVSAFAAANLSGALFGLYEAMMVSFGDATLLSTSGTQAVALDTTLTTDLLVNNAVLWTSYIAGLRTYFNYVGQANLIDGFLTANGIRVHQNFDQMHYLTSSLHLSAVNVFNATVQTLGTISTIGTGYAKLVLAPDAARAKITIDPGVANTSIDYVANTAGVTSSGISIVYINPNANNQTLYVEVENRAIRVHLATGPGGAITTTANAIISAIVAHTQATALVTATNHSGSSGAGIVTAMPQTFLSNYDTSVTFTAVTQGAYGNTITVSYIYSGGPLTSLSVSVTGTAIAFTLATDASSQIITTGTEIVALVASTASVLALVNAAVTSGYTGSDYVSAVSATNLAGGAVASLSGINPLGTGGVTKAGPNSYAAQNIQIAVTPAVSYASWIVYPSGAKAFATVDPPGTNNTVKYTAVVGGTSGNTISISYVYNQSPNTTLAVSVNANAITVTMATDINSQPTSTANDIITIINATGASNALVVASPVGTVTGIVGVSLGPVFLTNLRTKLLYTAVASGPTGNSVTITYVVAGLNTVFSVGVVGNDITVNMATDGSGNCTTIANDIITNWASYPAAVALATPTLPAGGFGDGVLAAFAKTPLYGGDGPNLTRNTTLALTLTRSDLVSVVRNVSFTAGATPGTIATPSAISATLTTGTVAGNNAIIYTAVTAGTSGNGITVSYINPGTPSAALSVAVVSNAITVSLGTDTGSNACSSADDVVAAVNGYGPAAALVTAAVSGKGNNLVVVQTATALSGGTAVERYFGITAVAIVAGGETGDTYTVSQIVERAIHL